VLIVALDSAHGATLVLQPPSNPPTTMRFGYPTKLATSVRGRLKRLQGGANPAELQLGHDCSAEQCTTLLGYLDAKWYQPPRRVPAIPPQPVDLCCGGLAAAYFRVRGRTFSRDDTLGRIYTQQSKHLQSLDAVADYDRGRDDAERTWPWEQWQGSCEWRDAALWRTGAVKHRWFLEQLVVIRDDERTRLGYVTRVMQDVGGELALSLRMWSAVPKCVSVRPLLTALSEDPPLPALLLAETPEDKASLCLPPRTFSPGRVLRSIDPGAERIFRLTRLLQRGADFERVAFEESI
jgi:hypothetical protein